MPNYLIGYKDPEKNYGHEDPLLEEFTYGDLKLNGQKLLELNKGDVLFFHKTIYDKRYITAYYLVEEVQLVKHALKDPLITGKYNNDHLKKDSTQLNINETIVFGNPIRSKVLEVPLEITVELLSMLSKKANLNPKQTVLASISSALRTWKQLNEQDVKFLLEKINVNEEAGRLTNQTLSTEEVYHILERDIEKFIAENPRVLGKDFTLERQQFIFSDESRLDLLLHDHSTNEKIVIEIKKGKIGREAKKQINHYMTLCRDELGYQNIKGIIVCAGILPYFEEELNGLAKENIFVHTFGWKFHVNT